MTVLRNVLIILATSDNKGKLVIDISSSWSDSVNMLINTFPLALGYHVRLVLGLHNLRGRDPPLRQLLRKFERCECVLMLKLKMTEILSASRWGVSALVAEVESVISRNEASQRIEEIVEVHMASDGARYIEFHQLRCTFDEVEGKYISRSVVLPEILDNIETAS